MKITGDTIIGWGFKPGAWFATAIAQANVLADGGATEDAIKQHIADLAPKPPVLDPLLQFRTNSIPFGFFLDVDGAGDAQAEEDQIINAENVGKHMDALMRTPTLVAGAVMPDACPAGAELGTIPVGGVVAAKNAIHPGFHSADICCSMAITVFNRDMPVGEVLDLAQKTTHFGFGHRPVEEARQNKDLVALVSLFAANPFLAGLERYAEGHFMTQGDGNHFLYVGHLESTGQMALVTHHGSRGLGAQLYKRGMEAAKRHTAIHSPRTPEHNAWLDSESDQGRAYWEALQMIREWTKLNHYAIHDAMGQRMGNAVVGRQWNEHNFVFQRDDGLFYHGKGATPSYAGYSIDDTGRTLIPLNMGEPILIAEHANRPDALGFAPHGAGRNLSRTAHMRRLQDEFKSDSRGISERDRAVIMDREVLSKGFDIRFFTGQPDLSELPSAYKSADAVTAQISKYGLAKIVDRVLPAGTMMAGNTAVNWRDKKRAKRAQ